MMVTAIIALTITACKKEDIVVSPDVLTTKDFTYNLATQQITPDEEINALLESPSGIRSVYCYLIRNNYSDSLIYVINPTEEDVNSLQIEIPTSTYAAADLSEVEGVKVMVKHLDNSSFEGFINVDFFDPSKPQFSNFPQSISADIDGGITVLSGNIASEYGIKQVDIYDDFQTENTYVLVHSYTDLNNVKDYALNYDYMYRKAAQHIKVVATDIYNQTNEIIINMPVDVSLFRPKFFNFPSSVSGGTAFTGRITSVTGLKSIDIYDDKSGAYELVESLTNLNNSLNYNLTYTYTIRKRAGNIKIIAIDNDDVQDEIIIPLNTDYLSTVYRDVVMTAQTTGTNTIFFASDGTTKGNCDLNNSESTMSFLFYTTSNGPTFYSPTNTSGIASNFRCNGESWVRGNTGALLATRFRVLIDGASTGQSEVYDLFEANELDDLSEAFFDDKGISNPSSSAPRYQPSGSPSTSLFNLTDARLVYIRIPDSSGGFKNAILHVKEVTPDAGNSTIKFDIYVQK